MKKWLKRRVREWIGLVRLEDRFNTFEAGTIVRFKELSSLSADVSVHNGTNIILVSRVGGGTVKIWTVYFSGMHEVRECMDYINARYGSRTKAIDAPRNCSDMRY